MSCGCQVANADPSKPCPKCGADPATRYEPTGADRKRHESDRIKMLLKMTPGAKT